MKVWYEVFISNETGTRTLETSFDTLEEAKIFKIKKEKNIDKDSTLHIDKWKNIDNPVCIGSII